MNCVNPKISGVVIGLNCENTIVSCLESIKYSDYPDIIEIIYADGGSTDNSIELVKRLEYVNIIELHSVHQTPGKGRNAGWKAAKGEWVLFLDGDSVIDTGWVSKAVGHISEHIAAMTGWYREMYPRKNWYHFIADLEWDKPRGNVIFSGGNVLMRYSALKSTGGYDEGLICGEDIELSARIRNQGWIILCLEGIMCRHDINIARFSQYFKRSLRSGQGYFEAGLKMLASGEDMSFLSALRIIIKTLLIISLFMAAVFSKFHALFAGSALFIFFFPMRKIPFFMKKFDITPKEAAIYSLHCCIAVWLQFFGIMEYILVKQWVNRGE